MNMTEIKDTDDYYKRKGEIIEKFHREFFEKYYKDYDPTFRNVLEMLTRDANPYDIIETLIEDRKIIVDKFNTFLMYHYKPIIFK